MRTLHRIGVLLLLLCSARAMAAQRSPAPVKYGKWAVLATSIGLNILAADAHRDADRVFEEIEARCETDPALCGVAGGGYVDPVNEALYQETLRLDRRSRTFLVTGEAAFLGAAALFIWEFARPKAPPDNLPFEPEVSVRNGVTRLGLRVAW
jgi:hypothetical protein